jgi:adenylate cyclase
MKGWQLMGWIGMRRGVSIPAKAAALGLFTALVGWLVSITPYEQRLEEEVGLGWLFKLRGPRQAPAEVVVVTMDRESADQLKRRGLLNEPDQWPRSLHGHLVHSLTRQGAAVIAFDVLFDEQRDPVEDNAFAQAVREAGNVVLCEFLRPAREMISGGIYIENAVRPIPVLAQAAAVAPFPLPKVPVKVSQFWLFKPEAGDIPTLPVIAFHVYAQSSHRPFHHQLVQLLNGIAPDLAAQIAQPRRLAQGNRGVEQLVSELHQWFQNRPSLVPALLKALNGRARPASLDSHSATMLASLIKLYDGRHSRYLDLYGPPRTITTVPYSQVLTLDEKSAEPRLDFAGKAVFVGFSEQLPQEQKDSYYTVFSQEESGLDMSGVEIAATAFANLLEDRSVSPVRGNTQVLLLAFWGICLGLAFRLLPVMSLPLVVVTLSAGYLAFAYHLFVRDGTWLPLTVPLLGQAPLALFGALAWRYLDVYRERRHIHETLGYYLPRPVADVLVREGISTQGQRVHGICLATDAERYTTLSERLAPERLHALMNCYYKALFEPVRRRGGIISDIVGDAMLAIWATGLADRSLREQACLAALEIAQAAERFNLAQDGVRLPTRIGLHCGELVLGHVGAADHYEYRAVGDIVNTASRVQALNKYLSTRILVSHEILEGVDGFLSRALGCFLLSGKTVPILIHELICRDREADAVRGQRCERFAEALRAFQAGCWDKAAKAFQALILAYGEDGPSRYYLQLCEHYRDAPPEPPWAGVVVIAQPSSLPRHLSDADPGSGPTRAELP